ncbi:hypothetical protein C9J01_02505 [Photobacterium rosenbergii]|uniref:Uncharacterized protein n=1 Tax=Photobacterium rosenbergii TaxID=294936 RepID=A0A2T3NK56_9GAMM|nr:hypothetical protein [Photobacterium rosenbergii]PSW15901.1 hypothetical protein C9J01_02505 [Photobacterium rosenbergii]
MKKLILAATITSLVGCGSDSSSEPIQEPTNPKIPVSPINPSEPIPEDVIVDPIDVVLPPPPPLEYINPIDPGFGLDPVRNGERLANYIKNNNGDVIVIPDPIAIDPQDPGFGVDPIQDWIDPVTPPSIGPIDKYPEPEDRWINPQDPDNGELPPIEDVIVAPISGEPLVPCEDYECKFIDPIDVGEPEDRWIDPIEVGRPIDECYLDDSCNVLIEPIEVLPPYQQEEYWAMQYEDHSIQHSMYQFCLTGTHIDGWVNCISDRGNGDHTFDLEYVTEGYINANYKIVNGERIATDKSVSIRELNHQVFEDDDGNYRGDQTRGVELTTHFAVSTSGDYWSLSQYANVRDDMAQGSDWTSFESNWSFRMYHYAGEHYPNIHIDRRKSFNRNTVYLSVDVSFNCKPSEDHKMMLCSGWTNDENFNIMPHFEFPISEITNWLTYDYTMVTTDFATYIANKYILNK